MIKGDDVALIGVGYYVIMAFVDALPTPEEVNPKHKMAYTVMYKVVHTLSANWSKLRDHGK